jgi:hypothetical protein
MDISTLTPEMEAVIRTIAELEEQRAQQERIEEQRQVMAQNHYLTYTNQIGVGG